MILYEMLGGLVMVYEMLRMMLMAHVDRNGNDV